jgi:hypothetical protein
MNVTKSTSLKLTFGSNRKVETFSNIKNYIMSNTAEYAPPLTYHFTALMFLKPRLKKIFIQNGE